MDRIITKNNVLYVNDTLIPKNSRQISELKGKGVRFENVNKKEGLNLLINETTIDGVLVTSVDTLMNYFLANGFKSDSGGGGSDITVDQSYNPNSTNPQSGTSVAEALKPITDELNQVDEQLMNTPDFTGMNNAIDSRIDQSYNALSNNAMSGTAVAEALKGTEGLDVTYLQADMSNGYINTGATVIGNVQGFTVLSNPNIRHLILNVKKDDKITLTTTGGDGARAWCFLDSNNLMLSKSGVRISTDNLVFKVENDGKMIVHFDVVAKVKDFNLIQYRASTSIVIPVDEEFDKDSKNAQSGIAIEGLMNSRKPFYGKKVFFAGDSQTMYGRYFAKFLSETGMQMIGNTGELGNGGRIIELVSFLKKMDETNLIKWDEIDLFSVLLGGNDYGQNTLLGTFEDDKSKNTIYGGVKNIVDYVLNKNTNIRIAFFTRPERDNVENYNNVNNYWFTTKKLKGITQVDYTGYVEHTANYTDGGIAIAGYDENGVFLRNILEANGTGYTNEIVNIDSDIKQIRICSKGTGAGQNFSFKITSDSTDIPTGTELTESNIDAYREKSIYVLPKGYIINNTYYNIYIWRDGYCDNRSVHYAPGPNLSGNTMYDINLAILDCANRLGVNAFNTHSTANVVYGYNLRDLMPDGTHFNESLGAKMGELMGKCINNSAY